MISCSVVAVAAPALPENLRCEFVTSARDRGHPRLAQTLKPPLAHLSTKRQVIADPSKREIRSQAQPGAQRLCRRFSFPLHRCRRDEQGMRRRVLRGLSDRGARPLDAFRIAAGGKMSERHGE